MTGTSTGYRLKYSEYKEASPVILFLFLNFNFQGQRFGTLLLLQISRIYDGR